MASSVEAQAEGSVGFDEGSLARGGFKGGGGSGKAEQAKFISFHLHLIKTMCGHKGWWHEVGVGVACKAL